MQSVLHPFIGPQKVHPENLDGRVAVVLGGAFGIGYEVSRALANAGCRVTMVNRKEDQGDDAISKIMEESPDAQVDWKGCDLGNLSQVRSVFSELRDSLDRLDYLVLSAGINTNTYGEDFGGIDRHFGVNYLGQYYAANQLWPLIRKTSQIPGAPKPRIVAESSEMHRTAPPDVRFENLAELNNPQMDPTRLYGRSKLALILFVRFGLFEQVIRPKQESIYALAVHPGAVNTAMQQQWKDAYPGITGKLLTWAMLAIGRDIEQGSYSALWALTADEIEEKDRNGGYFTDPGKPDEGSSQAQDAHLGLALWRLSEKLVKEKLGDNALVDWYE